MKKNLSFLVLSVIVLTAVFSFAPLTSAKSATSTSKNAKNQTGAVNAEEYRSAVANFVQALLKTASSTGGGLGQQVRLIAQEQNGSDATTTKLMEKIRQRGGFKTFLFGSDYKNLGALRSEMVKTRNRLEQLNRVMQRATSSAEVQAQIQNLEQIQSKIENFIQEQEGKFSLFGWLAKIFRK